MKNNYKNGLKLAIMLAFGLFSQTAFAQNQKVWTGAQKYFGVDSTANKYSSVDWTLGKPAASTSVKTDSVVYTRNLFTRVNFSNPTAAMLVDTVKVIETLNGCPSSSISKLVEVYPLPICSLGSNQTICGGGTVANFNVYISNYAAISGIGTFSLSYEMRTGSATGTVFSSGNLTGINSGTLAINASAWTGMVAGTSYYFVITAFASEITATASNPAPGAIDASALASLPKTYTIIVNPATVTPSIKAY